ncbi:polyprenyl synthetase family protein [Streptomyces sp. CC53]|uniref:polyprenyl synthetase family protein n=1 Tax=Streptomyces sp. CC53 TaxID=1906740 RepID=UPI0009A0F549|nr:polyprenyl synthetase family protein [Streptomyces sp. CC53]
MTAAPITPHLDLPAFRRAVDTHLEHFLDHKARAAADHAMPPEILRTLRDFLLRGGKRLRPLLCACGWHAAGGGDDTDTLVGAAAALEMFHAFALIHDDVMDRSATRRGHPTVHHTIATAHHGHRGTAAEQLGASAAILIGDLALIWSDELLATHLPPEPLAAVRPFLDAMRTEVMYGQYLDLLTTGRPTSDIDTPLRVIRYKTAKYTVERPLHIGAALAGADPAVLNACTAFALPLGEAFQLRDDLLGVFGAPEQTGKPVLDDLRDGKHTVLVALALTRATPEQRTTLLPLLATPDLDENGAARIRTVLDATGAHAETENMIRTRHREALTALDQAPFPHHVTAALRQIAHAATSRTT